MAVAQNQRRVAKLAMPTWRGNGISTFGVAKTA